MVHKSLAGLVEETGVTVTQSIFRTLKSPHNTRGRLQVDKDINELFKCTKALTEVPGG